jgi:hypothetical protein
MVESSKLMEQAKIQIKSLTSTQDSIEQTATLFLELSAEGQSEMLFNIWQYRFKKAAPSQMLCLIYLLSHIILTGSKDNYALKRLFEPICKSSIEETYKYTFDANNRKVLRDIVLLWQNRKTFKTVFLKELLSSLEQLESTIKNRPTFLLDSLQDVVVDEYLVNFGRKLKCLNDWEEKIKLTEKPLNAVADKLADYNEIVELQLAVLEEAIKQRQEYANLIKETAEDIFTKQNVIKQHEEEEIEEFTGVVSRINLELSM